MKIGVLTTSFPAGPRDASGAFVLEMARALAARGHEVEALAPERELPAAPPPDERIRLIEVPYLRPRALQRTFGGAGVPDKVRRDPTSWPGLASYPVALAAKMRARRSRWDAVISHWALPSGLVASSLSGGMPHLAVMHSADVTLLEKMPRGPDITRRIARGARALWVTNEAHASTVRGLLGDAASSTSILVSPMGFEPSPRVNAALRARVERASSEGTVVCFAGRLVHLKGADVLIEAARGLEGIRLRIAGEGPERSKLEAQARALGVEARFVGTIFGDEKARFLAEGDLFVAPSRVLASGRSEGVPVTMIEALGAGLPVIASAAGGIGTFARGREAIELVAQGDVRALRRALIESRASPGERARRAQVAQEAVAELAWPVLAELVEAHLVEGRGSVVLAAGAGRRRTPSSGLDAARAGGR